MFPDSWDFMSKLQSGMTRDIEYGHFVKKGHTYYTLPHNTSYKVKMSNNTHLRVNARLKVDGVCMGVWRIGPYSDILVERPTHSQRKFTFVKENSWEAKMGGMNAENNNNGLIEVAFTPELKTAQYHDNRITKQCMTFNSARSFSDSLSNYSVGGTVLGDDSSQRFDSASRMIEDESRRVIKRLRLVIDEKRQPYTSIRREYDQSIYDDPVPPKLGNLQREDLFLDPEVRRIPRSFMNYDDTAW